MPDLSTNPDSTKPAISAPSTPKKLAKLRMTLARPAGGFLAQMRIRKKLFVLHTFFSLGLAIVLLGLLRPAVTEIVELAEADESALVLRALAAEHRVGKIDRVTSATGNQANIQSGSPAQIGITPELAARCAGSPGVPFPAPPLDGVGRAAMFSPDAAPRGSYFTASVRIAEARAAVTRLYFFTAAALLGVYALVAAALELLVLPQYVYAPIRRMLDAEQAVQNGRSEDELIPDSAIPADELGEIMRSRNTSILSLRKNQTDLADALSKLEEVATDLQRKNHLLENARRNLADADRLASLGMMSAGIAHELNTPLAVLKGLVEKLNDTTPANAHAHSHTEATSPLNHAEAALMLRVVGRLERLGESLLDFARVRPPRSTPTDLHAIVQDAATLVRLDRKAAELTIENTVPAGTIIDCDSDRIVQVLVNLLRNAADAINRRNDHADAPPRERGLISINCLHFEKDGREWIGTSITDNGPGIDPQILPRLFEPFASTRLDSHGTGLGLAVSDGIVREHGGMILARNRPARSGSIFEIMLPVRMLIEPPNNQALDHHQPSQAASPAAEPAPHA